MNILETDNGAKTLYPVEDSEIIITENVQLQRAPEETGYEWLYRCERVQMDTIGITMTVEPQITKHGRYKEWQDREYMRKKIQAVINAAEERTTQDILIITTIGCDENGHPPWDVAEMWKEHIQESKLKRIIFSVPKDTTTNRINDDTKQAFIGVFGYTNIETTLQERSKHKVTKMEWIRGSRQTGVGYVEDKKWRNILPEITTDVETTHSPIAFSKALKRALNMKVWMSDNRRHTMITTLRQIVDTQTRLIGLEAGGPDDSDDIEMSKYGSVQNTRH